MSEADPAKVSKTPHEPASERLGPTLNDSDPLPGESVSPNSIEGLFLRALRLESPADRECLVRETCGDDHERAQRVTALLRAYEDAGSFLETPVGGSRPTQGVSLSFLKPSDNIAFLGTIGPYQVLETIGCGGMGIVMRAVDPKLNRVVAVKALLPELAANPNSRRRFLREAQAAAAVSHPHVVTIHAVDDSEQEHRGTPVPPYLVMECVIGQSLQQKLDRVGPLRLAEILRISRQIGDGLAAAHKQGLIHRDIKPANILLENGVERVKITDFGLARAIDDITVTRTGEVCGTPQYMSPEQACGERVDHRSDLFSLGCVMYAMCTGHSPFRGDSIAHVIKRVTQDMPRPIGEQNPEIPSWLTEIIDSLLQKNPEHRIRSAKVLVSILDQHLSRIQHPTESGSHSAINQQIPSDGISGRSPTKHASGEQYVTNPKNPVQVPFPISAPLRLRISNALLWLGIPAWCCGVAGVIALWNNWTPISISNRPEVDIEYFTFGGLGLGVATLLVAMFLRVREDPKGPSGVSLLLFFLVGGPIGILIWLLLRESYTRRNVSMQFGAMSVQVPSEAAFHYLNLKAFGRFWILLTLAGVILSLVLHPTLSHAANTTEILSQALQFPVSLFGIWILMMLGTKVFRPNQVPMRMWALESSSMFVCMALGYFWTTVLRMPFSGNSNELTSRSLMGAAILPTMICVLYCGYVFREMVKNPKSLRALENLSGRNSPLSRGAFLVLVTSVLLVLGAVSVMFWGLAQSTLVKPRVSKEVTAPAEFVEARTSFVLIHPDWGKIRQILVNGLGSTRQERSATETEIFPDPKLFRTGINIHVILMDGREWTQSVIPRQLGRHHLTISELDLMLRNRSLVEVIEDAPGVKLRMVSYPTQQISVNEFDILERPFHKALEPGEHRIVLDYVLDEWELPEDVVQYNKLDYRVKVEDDSPIKLSLKEIIEQHGAKAKTTRMNWKSDFKPLPQKNSDVDEKSFWPNAIEANRKRVRESST